MVSSPVVIRLSGGVACSGVIGRAVAGGRLPLIAQRLQFLILLLATTKAQVSGLITRDGEQA